MNKGEFSDISLSVSERDGSPEVESLEKDITELKDCFVENNEGGGGTTTSVKVIPVQRHQDPNESSLHKTTLLDFFRHIKHPKQRVKSPHRNRVLRWVDNFFGVTTLKSTLLTEIIGGVTIFLTSAYLLAVHPMILSFAGMDPNAVFVVTALLTGIGTISMGIVANVPMLLAPGMGLNALFATTFVLTYGYSWRAALGITLISGVLNLICVLFGVRKKFILALPEFYRIGLAVGIALFLALIGAQNMQLIQSEPNTILTFGKITWRLGVALLCVVVMCGLILRKVRVAFIVPIIGASVLVVIIRAIFESDELTLGTFGQLTIQPVAFQLNFDFDLRALYLVPVLLFHHLFDSLATVLALLRQAYLSGAQFEFTSEEIASTLASSRKVRHILVINAIFSILSALLGTSTTTPFIETSTGISLGARTGLTSVVAGVLFLIAMFVGPLIQFIAAEATGASLVVTAMMFIPFLRHLDFNKMEEVFPALFTMITIPFTFNIGNGAALGYASLVTWVFMGKERIKMITPLMWVLIVLSILQIVTNML